MASAPSPSLIPIIIDGRCVGHLLNRGRAGVEVFDAADLSIGIPSAPDAVAALLRVMLAGARRDLMADEPEDDWARDRESWADAAVHYHKDRGNRPSLVEYKAAELARLRSLLINERSLDRAKAEIQAHHEHHPHHGVALSTIEALMFGLRERDTKALAEPKVRGRISQLSKVQIAEVAARLRQLEPHIAQAWTADETQQLIAKWGELHRD
jgi:hypothetical protein